MRRHIPVLTCLLLAAATAPADPPSLDTLSAKLESPKVGVRIAALETLQTDRVQGGEGDDEPAPSKEKLPDPDVVLAVGPALMEVNGQREIPAGLFGLHAYKVTPARVAEYGIDCYRQIHFHPSGGSRAIGKDGKVHKMWGEMPVFIDCMGDRYATATVLKRKDYAEVYRKMGASYARQCKTAGHDAYVEFWNEPYLNWASRSHGSGRNHYNPKWYDLSKAKPGGKVTIKGWDEPLEHLRWRKRWARGEDGKIYYGVDIPEGAEPGDTFQGASPSNWYFTNRKKQTFTVVEQWGVWDPTQTGFWSGRQNLQFYLWMFKPFARAVKEVYPETRVIAGWDFGYSHGDWSVWKELYEPLLDEAGEYIDGLSEHHYGIHPRWVPVWYEVATAYSMSRHGRWVRGYNTECGGKLDPAVYGKASRDVTGLGEARYVLTDIMGLLHYCPAKGASRTHHHPGKGTLETLKFFKPLRGPMAATEGAGLDADRVLRIASVHDGKLAAIFFNDTDGDMTARLKLQAPEGTTFQGGSVLTYPGMGKEAVKGRGRTELTLQPLHLPARRAVRVILALEGDAPQRPQVVRKQVFAREGVLKPVAKDKPLTLTFNPDPKLLADATHAWLHTVAERVDQGEAKLEFLNQPGPDTVACDVPHDRMSARRTLDPADLRRWAEEGVLTLKCTAAGDGWQLDAASIVLQAPASE